MHKALGHLSVVCWPQSSVLAYGVLGSTAA